MANELFDTLFATGPRDKIFIELADGTDLTYGEFEAATGRAVGALSGLGVKAGDRVAAQVDKSVGALVLYLASIRCGAVFLPLNTAYTPAEVEYFVGDAEPTVFVCRPESEAALRPFAEAAGTRLLTMDAGGRAGSWPPLVRSGPGNFEPVTRGGDDVAAILYTSGTTGRAKGAMLSHRNLASNALTLSRYWQFSAEDVLLHALPIFHTHGLFVAVNTVMVAGASMIFLPRFDAAELVALMSRATVLMGVPTFYTRLLDEPGLDAEAAGHMRLFVSGSAPLLAETHREFRARTGHAILERYGMTETSMNTSNPYEGERRAGTVGLPLPDVEVRVTDPESGVPMEQGGVGMLEVRGPNVFQGYWRMPKKTRAEFREDGFFITGDMGYIDDRGYVVIVGRGRDLIISGGYNVYPKEVEMEIDALPGVKESAVIGVPHPDFGEGVVAVVVTEPDAGLDEAGVITRISARLARYKQPRRVVFLDALPRNTMGKVQKNLLRDEYKHLCNG
jgi:malonyl-CoA/methylmalonyl-CoA synthetase